MIENPFFFWPSFFIAITLLVFFLFIMFICGLIQHALSSFDIIMSFKDYHLMDIFFYNHLAIPIPLYPSLIVPQLNIIAFFIP
jgi:hypothetical protein